MTTSRCTADRRSSVTECVVLDRKRKGSAPSTGWTVHWIGRSLLLARPRLGPPDTSAQRRRFWHRRPCLTSAKYFGFHLQLSLVQCARSNRDALTSRDRKGHNLICKPDTHECVSAESDPLKCIDLSSGDWFVQTKIDFLRSQVTTTGMCSVLQHEGRYVFYLVKKARFITSPPISR